MPSYEKVLTITNTKPKLSTSDSHSTPPEGWLRSIREAQGLTRRQIAAQLGVTVPAIQDYERSEAAGKITLTTLRKYAEVLGCAVTVTVAPQTLSPAPETRPPRSSPKRKPRPASAAPIEHTDIADEENSAFNDRMGLWSAQ